MPQTEREREVAEVPDPADELEEKRACGVRCNGRRTRATFPRPAAARKGALIVCVQGLQAKPVTELLGN